MNRLALRLEHTSLFFAISVISIVLANFAMAHQLSNDHEARFLFSGVLLLFVTLYLRFAVNNVTEVHRALYRISTVMLFWAIGIYLFPYPGYLHYLIALPALFFIYRLEVKRKRAPQEDWIALGIMLTISTFLYIQQQPLQAVLFPESDFHWGGYYHNAPIIALVGIGFIRLQKWAQWPSLVVIGVILCIVGLTLSLAMIGKDANIARNTFAYWVLVNYALLLLTQTRNPLIGAIVHFSGLERKEHRRFATLLYWISISGLQAGIAVALVLFPQTFWGPPLIVVAACAMLFRYRRITTSLLMIEISALVYYMGEVVIPQYLDLCIWVFAALLIVPVVLKRSERYHRLVDNRVVLGCYLIFYLLLSNTEQLLSPIGLVWLAIPYICWLLLPDRPFTLAPFAKTLSFPVLTAAPILCINGAVDLQLLPLWANITLIPAAIALLSLQSEKIKGLIENKEWHWLEQWREDAYGCIALITAFAFAITLTSIYINLEWYQSQWHPVLQSLLTLSVCAITMIVYGARHLLVRHLIIGELFIWTVLGLLRWKLEVLEALSLGTPLDGYLLMAVGAMVAGLREITRRGHPEFSHYFYRMTLIYSLIGWAYLIFISLTTGEGLAGELSSIYLAALYYWLSRSEGRKNIIFTFVFINIAMGLFFYRQALDNPMFYLMPVLGSALVLAHLFKDQLSSQQLGQIRLYCSLIMLSTAALYNISSFSGSIWYPVTAAGVSLLGVVLGIALRIRVYLYLGFSFFFVNVAGIVGNVIINQPPGQIKLIIGMLFLVTGAICIGSYVLFQMKRQQILAQYEHWRGEISRWE